VRAVTKTVVHECLSGVQGQISSQTVDEVALVAPRDRSFKFVKSIR
jgi:hypothetical protein